MEITITRSASHDEIAVDKDGTVHHYDLSPLNRNQRSAVREMVVDAWATEHGFEPVYNKRRAA
jgi:hypothetical protein